MRLSEAYVGGGGFESDVKRTRRKPKERETETDILEQGDIDRETEREGGRERGRLLALLCVS